MHWSSIKRISSSYHWNATCSRHDIDNKKWLIWCLKKQSFTAQNFDRAIFEEVNPLLNLCRIRYLTYSGADPGGGGTRRAPHLKLEKNMIFWRKIVIFHTKYPNNFRTSFSGGGSRSTRREPPTMGKQLVNFITCGCESSAPFFVIYKAGLEPTPYWW